MSWIIKDGNGYVQGYSSAAYVTTQDRDDAKRFETKADAKAVQDQYGLGGSIIPA